ncbi:MAG: B12-binding domain-containing radical SAM protein [Lachnospiraceae bacterium]|nr:B12-binding domain-containing radical SAM protein [Lachnospiraceae bacterium]
MKFLLVALNAKYIHTNLAVRSLAAYVGEELSSYVEIAEYTINMQKEEVVADIVRRKPDAVGFSCYIWNMVMIEAIVADLHLILDDLPIWLGGPEVSYDTQERLRRLPYLAGIIAGEGEAAFLEILQKLVHSEPREKQSLVLQSSNPIDLTQVPFWFLQKANENPMQPGKDQIIYYESSRGCPFGCAYCLSGRDQMLRFRDLEVVKAELDVFLRSKVAQVKFVDRTFNADRRRAREMIRYLQAHDNGVTNFHFEIAGDLLEDEDLVLFGTLRPGFVQLEIGIQSTNVDTLKAISRSVDQEELWNKIEVIRAAGNVHQHLDLIVGLPYEDYASLKRSFDRVYMARPQQFQLGFLKVLKGSMLATRTKEWGIVYSSQPPYEVISTTWISYEEIQKLKQVENALNNYYNSGQYTCTLPILEGLYETPFALYEALGEFHRTIPGVRESSSRISRYEKLFDFVCRYFPTYQKIVREKLTFDFYLRENAKTRPKFAPDREQWAESIRQFYRQEALQKKVLTTYGDCDSSQLRRLTHIEVFSDRAWLFDYQMRNPFTNNAQAIDISDYFQFSKKRT